MSVSIIDLTFEHHYPLALGIGESEPRISWRFDGSVKTWTQSSYDLEINRNGVSQIHTIDLPDLALVPWPEVPLGSGEQASVRRRAHGETLNSSTPWSDSAIVEAGLSSEQNWTGAVPIAAERASEIDGPKRPICFRISSCLGDEIERARLYITALGLYEAEVTGQGVGGNAMAPRWTSYNFRHAYDTYDITELVRRGENVSESPLVKAVTLANGTELTLPTDTTWQASTGPLFASEIYNGEIYDFRLENGMHVWSTSAFNGSNWLPTEDMAYQRTTPNRTQTAYALTLDFNLLSPILRPNAIKTLRSLVSENEYFVGTGFAETPSLGFALSNAGHANDISMLLQTKVPSWLYQVVQNGTTTWERWDSLLPNGTVHPGEMTSFNHYAFRSVSSLVHRVIGRLSPLAPGWKRILIAPVPGGNLTWAESRFVSPYGKVRSSWWIEEDGFHLDVQVPPNARADVKLPGNGKTKAIGSGTYSFYEPNVRVA
ncbi:putative rhamnosidase [Aspergillus undulatus]|uniref:putative rhamnosidase n=1 Tax=Aspergillus undulatus TaxID=1810928 RepID=UPI003CCC91BF